MLTGFKYLKEERGLTDETIRSFNLSYCDEIGNIYTNVDFPFKDLELDKKFYNTVLFPIVDLYGALVGVSGRNLLYKTKADNKYVNTVYPKSQHLYGLNVAVSACLSQNKVYIVEGNVDTMTLYQHGIHNVVGMLGSSLSLTQFTLLSRFVDDVYIVADNDDGGDKLITQLVGKPGKTGRIEKFNQLHLNYYSVRLPLNYDPDKFVNEKGAQEFLKLEKVKLNKQNIGGVR